MAERITGTDASGIKYEFKNGQWVPMAEDPGIIGAGLIGAGETFATLGRGAADLGANLVQDIVPGAEQFREDLMRDQLESNQLMQPLQEMRPISTMVGQALPYVAAAPLGGSRVGGQVALDAALGGLGLGTPEERLQRAGFGAVGALGGNAVQRVLQGIRSGSRAVANQAAETGADFLPGTAGAAQVGEIPGPGRITPLRRAIQNAGRQITGEGIESPTDVRHMLTLRQQGYLLRPGSQTGNRAADQLMSFTENNPLLADVVQQELNQVNKQNFNRQLLGVLGREVPETRAAEFAPETIAQLRNETAGIVDEIKAANPTVKITDAGKKRIRRLRTSFVKDVSTISAEDPAQKVIDNTLEQLNRSTFSTDRYTRIRSRLRDLQINASERRQRARADLLGGVVEELDKMFERSVGKADAEKFRLATGRFRLLEALDQHGVVSPEGDINIPSLNRVLRQVFKDEYGGMNEFGGLDEFPEFGQLFDTVKAFNRFRDIPMGSPTATRLQARDILTEPGLTAATLAARPIVRAMIRNAQISPEELVQWQASLQ